MIKDETIEKLESVGLRVDCALHGMSIYSAGGAMPELFVLDTTKGLVKLGESIEFTQSSPTLFTKKQLDKTRLRVAALNPVTYKVN
nr:MAG TPA: hypothetical protein [Caudoviricetes sp.]